MERNLARRSNTDTGSLYQASAAPLALHMTRTYDLYV